jgi:hypothetical protein
MSLAHSLSPKLGVALTPAGKPPKFNAESDDLRFQREISQLVHDLLRKHYKVDPFTARQFAHQRGMTLEQLLAATITHLIMQKVDEEYF